MLSQQAFEDKVKTNKKGVAKQCIKHKPLDNIPIVSGFRIDEIIIFNYILKLFSNFLFLKIQIV